MPVGGGLVPLTLASRKLSATLLLRLSLEAKCRSTANEVGLLYMGTFCLFKEMVLGEGKLRPSSLLYPSDSRHIEFWFQETGSESHDLSIKSEEEGDPVSSHLEGLGGKRILERGEKRAVRA